jgi:copper(I)-binding protein
MHRLASFILAALCASTVFAQTTVGHGAGSHAGHGAPAGSTLVTKGPAKNVTVRQCWVRNMPATLVSAAYFEIVNQSAHAIEITGLSSLDYGSAMMHATHFEGGMAHMTDAPWVRVQAGHVFKFQPGGHHVMLDQSTAPRTEGEQITLLFTLADGHSLQADCTIKPASAVGP